MQGCVISCGTVVFFQNHATFYDHCSLITISTVLYASFDTFFVQIGQLFQAQWAFEEWLKIVKFSIANKYFCRYRKTLQPLKLVLAQTLHHSNPYVNSKITKKDAMIWLQTFVRCFSKIFCLMWIVGCTDWWIVT